MTNPSTPEARAAWREPQCGDVLGRYQLLQAIAVGGMGKVWAARQLGQLGFRKLVAIKTALPEFAANPDFEHLFLDEARIASAIHHPNVCGIYELGEQDHVLYLAMEWISGGSLANLLAAMPAPQRLPPRLAARIVAEACAGLHAAHELKDDEGVHLGVVHRDVSPQNILLSLDGHVKVADFGVAKARGQLHQATMTGELKGKVSYLAPEQLTSKTFDHRADIFALGCVLYQAAVGQRPFQGDGALVTIYQILESSIELPSVAVPDFPADLEAIILRALARKPEDRYATAEDMRVALEGWLARTGPLVTEMQIGELVRSVSGPALEEKTRAIREAEEAIAAPGGASKLASLDRAKADAPLEVASESSQRSIASAFLETSGRTSSSGKRTGLYLVAGAALVLLASGGVKLAANASQRGVTSVAGAAAAAAVPAPAAPAPSATSPAAAPSSTDVGEIAITVRVHPESAVILLDGVRALPNPYIGRMPRDNREHSVEAMANGYTVARRVIRFDVSQSIELALTAAPASTGHPAKSSPARPRAPAAPQPVVEPEKTVAAPGASGRPRKHIDQSDPFSE